MPTIRLPSDPSLENLKKQAKALRKAALDPGARAAHEEAAALVAEFHPRGRAALADLSLGDAQLVIARRYGFASWPRLKKRVEVVREFARSPHAAPEMAAAVHAHGKDVEELVDEFVRLACLVYGGDHKSRRAR